MDTVEEKWLALQDPLMQVAYHTITGVIAEKDDGKQEAYYELFGILKNFALRRRATLQGEANARN